MNIVERAKKFMDNAKASGVYGYDGPQLSDLEEALNGKIIYDEISHQDRWTTWYIYIIKADGEYLKLVHGVGSTEYQENMELYDAVDSFQEVEPVQVTVTQYRQKK